MDYNQLDTFLYELTELEKSLQYAELTDEMILEQILTSEKAESLYTGHSTPVSADNQLSILTNPPAYNYTLENGILKLNVVGEAFVISRHTRFVRMINHTHNLFEMNYVYSGTFYQEIQGQRFKLTAGDLIILNKNVEHSIDQVGKEDILINFLAKNEFFDSAFIYKILGDNVMGKTIASILTNETRDNKFLLFRTAEHWQIRQTIQNILCEAIDNRRRSNSEIIKAYLTILFSRLLETENYEMYLRKVVKSPNISIVNLLAYIDANYLNMTLEDTANQFNYSPEHLGRIIKKVTGKTFSALIHEQKFKHAARLLRTTDQTVESISEEIGYRNLTYFYRKFHDLYESTPRDYRRQFRKE
ncbi:AraC family transcriptional regulator [Paenibacillus sp. P46E]|uniref:AraC family transcriptional regulator n=1 Tax=Paenibacillus sp. P46E TaxID=1349436 RepID=UPI00093AB549|nr:AraC family transcriptional regulator [Paenibacillus sp. P46E]OKP94251.1 hypothetical protein A3849_29745 [Paenibacillus sp. P46E]